MVDSNGHMGVRGEQPLAMLPNVLTDEQLSAPCILLAPGEKIRITRVNIPSTNAKKIHQALPFAVEELIADEIETTHLATGEIKRENNGFIDVAIVRHQLIIEWIDLCHQYGIAPHYIIPDSLCIPWEANSWSFYLDTESDPARVLVRRENLQAQVVGPSLAALLLDEMMVSSAASQQALTIKPQVNFYAAESAAEIFKSWRNTLPATPDHDQRESLFREDLFEMMAMQAVTRIDSLINLRQGGYRVPVDLRSSGRWWRQTVATAVAGSMLFIFATLGKALWYESQASKIQQQSIALYKEIYPEARRVINPRKQMESALSGGIDLSANDEFSATLEDVGKLIASSQNAEVSIQSLLFSADQPETISMSIVLSQEDALEEMRQRLSTTDLRIDGAKATPVSNGVAVDFRLLRGQ